MEAPEQTDPSPDDFDSIRKVDPPEQEAVPLDETVKKILQARGVKSKCNACHSFGWANFEIGIVAWLTTKGPAHIALLICQKCAHLEPFDLQALGISFQAPEPSRIIKPEEALKQRIVTG
jgi:hypothetical protein